MIYVSMALIFFQNFFLGKNVIRFLCLNLKFPKEYEEVEGKLIKNRIIKNKPSLLHHFVFSFISHPFHPFVCGTITDSYLILLEIKKIYYINCFVFMFTWRSFAQF